MEAFLLGLSSGVVCVAYCAPVLVPCLLAASGGGMARAAGITGGFLGGRLLGYLVFAVLAWLVGMTLPGNGALRATIVGGAYVVLSVMLVIYALTAGRKGHTCAVPRVGKLMLGLSSGRLPALMPPAMGLATGISFCPPFLLALASSSRSGSLVYSLFFFFMFFLGTSLFFVPSPFLGLVRSRPAVTIVGRLCAGLMGAYYLVSGSIMFAGGLKSL
jgi:hypothetical protein